MNCLTVNNMLWLMTKYKNCDDYQVNVWNYDSYRFEHIVFDEFVEVPRWGFFAYFKPTNDGSHLKTWKDWKETFDKFKDSPEYDRASILIRTSQKRMILDFCDIDKEDKKISFVLNEADEFFPINTKIKSRIYILKNKIKKFFKKIF